MNSENVPKERVKSYIDLAKMAKGLIDENQQPSVQQELERLFYFYFLFIYLFLPYKLTNTIISKYID